MYTNAGIRPQYSRDAPNVNRHAVSNSDPPISWNSNNNSSSNLYSYSHQPRLSDGYVFPSTASTSSSRPARTTVYAPPSSFHSTYLSSTSTAPSRHYQTHAASSSSASSFSILGTHNYKPNSSSSLTSLTNPLPNGKDVTAHNTSKPLDVNPVMAASSSSSTCLPRRNGSTPSAGALNVKRLMSKPTAIPPRANSVLSFSDTHRYHTDGQGEPSDTDESYHATKSRSLDILTRSKRRSRSVDIMRASTPDLQLSSFNSNSLANRPSQRHPTLHGKDQLLQVQVPSPSLSLQGTTSPPSSYLIHQQQHVTVNTVQSPTSPGTIRPGNRLSQGEENKVDSQNRMRTSSAEVVPSPQHHYGSGTPRSSFTTTSISPVTPASAIALAWTESQKRASAATAAVATNSGSGSATTISSPSSSLLQPNLNAVKGASRSKSLPASPSSIPPYPHVNTITTTHTGKNSTLINNKIDTTNTNNFTARTPHSRRTVPGTGTSPKADATMEDDPYVSWVVADRVLSPIMGGDNAQAPSYNNNNHHLRSASSQVGGGVAVGGMSATMRELSRRLTGAFGRREKGRDKINYGQANHHDGPPFGTAEHIPIRTMMMMNKMASANSSSVVEPWPVSKAPTIQTQTSSLTAASTFHEPPSASHHPVGQSDAGHSDRIPFSITTTTTNTAPVDNLNDVLFRPSLSTTITTTTTNSKHHDDETEDDHHPLDMSMLSPQVLSPTTSRDTQELPRSKTPNTLKKRSRGSLRHKSSSSAIVPVGSERLKEQARDAQMIMSNMVAPCPPALDEDNSAAGKLRGLVRKLSSGGLRRSSSQSEKSRSTHGHTSSLAGWSSSNTNCDHVPPVPPLPPIPKDFELIVDPEAYFAERSKRRGERIDSDSDSAAHSSGLTPQRIPGNSQKSSRRSSPLPPSLHGQQSEPIIPTTQQKHTSSESLPRPPPRRARTEPIPIDHVLTVHSIPPSTRYIFPKRPKPKADLSSSVGSTSYSVSGTDHAGMGYRTSSPAPSSPDLPASRSHANHDDMASLSSHEMSSSAVSHSMIAHPIMAPKDLYRHGEDEAATLRNKQQAKDRPGLGLGLPRKRSFPNTTSEAPREMERSPISPPPKISPTLMAPLGVPPPRPPRREVKSKVSAASSTEVRPEKPMRPVHSGHQRSLSSPPPLSPGSPELPIFSNADAINAIPLSKRSRSLGGQPRSPRIPVEPPSMVIKPQQTLTRSKSQTSLKSKKAKTLPPLQLTPNAHIASAQSSPSPRDTDDTDGHSQRRLRVKTSIGALGRVKSLIGSSKSASQTPLSHTPSSSASQSLFSPQSAGRRSTSRRTSRDRVFVEDGDTPPVPFTSTAFAFKEISPMSPKVPKLTEGEKQDMWNALLEKSDRAGGTLTVALEQIDGPSLQSDNASFISAQGTEVESPMGTKERR